MRLLHLADVHLDAPFSWAGPDGGRARRRAIRDAFRSAIDLARAQRVDALCVAGDLFEHERISEDTARFLADQFAGLGPVPVLLAPGNHDWLGPASAYRRTAWPANVTVFPSERLTAVPLADGFTVWGAAHLSPSATRGFLTGFAVDRGGVNIAVFHGAEHGGLALESADKRPYAPFTAAQIAASGLDHALVGHLHTPIDGPFHTYPGNPEPLTFGETGVRGAVVVDVASDGTLDRTRHVLAHTEVVDLSLDVTGLGHADAVRSAALDILRGRAGVVRLSLHGDLDPAVDLDPQSWAVAATWLEALVVRTAGVHEAYDLEALRGENSVRGEFVRDVLSADLDAERMRRVLATGLRALDGRADLEVR